jgi:magnesium transporter
MQRLTIAATIFLPLTFIVGVYGMNFTDIPEFGWKGFYFILWGIMIALAGGMLWFFKRKKWL